MKNNLLNPFYRGLTDGAEWSMHDEAVETGTPSVEPDVGMFLRQFCYTAKPKNILELGCGIGVSTRYMSMGAPDAQITAVDLNQFRIDHAKAASAGKKINFVTSDVVDYVKKTDETFDLIFVDSMKRQYPIVFYYVYKMLNAGGTIIFDDMFVYGELFCQDCEIAPKYLNNVKIMREFINYIKNNFKHSFLPLGGGLLLVGK